jgi:hypothetical protein
MTRRALIVGIDHYDHFPSLNGCVADANGIASLLRRNSDESINFSCRVLTSNGVNRLTRSYLRQEWQELFHDFHGDILFYFSGHGTPTDFGGYLVTADGEPSDFGLPMNDVVNLANNSRARSVLLILDCCFSGSIGNSPNAQTGSLENKAELREGVTILAASRPLQPSMEVGGHGVFTNLVLGALRGGAADVRGRVSAASVYAYAEAALGAWEQRPVYKSHASQLDPVRLCTPKVTDSLLRELPTFFRAADAEYQLDPSYEETNVGSACTANVDIFKKFKKLQIAGLLKPKLGDDLYWTANRSECVYLTDLGRFYHHLVLKSRI